MSVRFCSFQFVVKCSLFASGSQKVELISFFPPSCCFFFRFVDRMPYNRGYQIKCYKSTVNVTAFEFLGWDVVLWTKQRGRRIPIRKFYSIRTTSSAPSMLPVTGVGKRMLLVVIYRQLSSWSLLARVKKMIQFCEGIAVWGWLCMC